MKTRFTAVLSAGVLVAAWMFVLERPVEAYVDPGAGSMLTQLLVGGVLGGLVVVRAGWHRIRGWFRRHPKRAEDLD